MTKRQLCKIEDKGKISGVCAGLADFFGLDVTLIRLIWVLVFFMGIGSPVLIYIVLAIILPEYDPDSVSYEEIEDDEYNDDDRY